MRPQPRTARRGFTLIELLVVVGIIAILASLLLMVNLRNGPAQKTAQGASQLQGWLLITKQRAYRDRVPRGVALIPSDDGLIRQLAYVEQPTDFSVGGPNNNYNIGATAITFDLKGGNFNNSCAKDDYLLIGYDLDRTNLYRIMAISADGLTLTISPGLRSNVFPGSAYRIIRAPREVDGEARLDLPVDIVIDPNPFGDATKKPPLPLNNMIIFSPSGGCTQDGLVAGKFILYVRDSSVGALEGEPTLITVYTRTGAITAHPVNPDLTQPWLFTQDGRSSGM